MPNGLQVFDGSGNLVMDITDRITKILGTVDSGLNDGGIGVSWPATGRPWVKTLAYTNGSPNQLAATAYISGNAIYWYFIGSQDVSPPFTIRRNTKITYGVY